jgi:hypothetical protein
MIAAAGASALMASYTGLILSFRAELPSGPAIVLVAGFISLSLFCHLRSGRSAARFSSFCQAGILKREQCWYGFGTNLAGFWLRPRLPI